MSKRYSMHYESDEFVCGSNEHVWANANTIKTAKAYIARCRQEEANNPRNFRIYDHFADVDESTGYAPCVYQED